MRTDVILANFSENIVVVGTSYKMLGILSLTDREAALPSSTEISELTVVVTKQKQNKTMKLREQSRKRKIKLMLSSFWNVKLSIVIIKRGYVTGILFL